MDTAEPVSSPETPDVHGAYPRLSGPQIEALAAHGMRRRTRPGDVRTTRPASGAGSGPRMLFVLIGAEPHVRRLGDQLAMDDEGFILTGPDAVRSGTERAPRDGRGPFLLETSRLVHALAIADLLDGADVAVHVDGPGGRDGLAVGA